MARDIRIVSGISKWIRESIGSEAENRGDEEPAESDGRDEAQDGAETEADGETEDEDDSSPANSPVCCSAASNTDLTVLDN